MKAGRYGASALVWVLLLTYASLYPFHPLRPPTVETVSNLLLNARSYIRSDIAFNFVAYVPFGTLLCLFFRSRGDEGRAILKAVAVAAGFSFVMELAQLFIPGRVSSVIDLAANTAGAVAGALVFADPFYSMVTRPLAHLRERTVIAGGWGDAALVLLMLWLLAQLNPALPFFGAGDIARGIEPELGALQWAAVALGICGFGLFVSALVRAETGSLRVTLLLLTVALWLKFAAASLMLQPHSSPDWASGGRVGGLIAGILAFVPLRKLARLGRIYLALVLILAGALFAKVFGAYSALDELLRLFRWPYGQLGSFATLTRFIHELWPFAAVMFLVALFFHVRHAPRTE
ncbi:MAG TPA: VanZ family protein [Usitatibacter sp.]|nr:VanZ family protein [Usitatibacter sp.]